MRIYLQRMFDAHITRRCHFSQYEMYGGTNMQVRSKMLLNPW
jgi:hypothetical protein